MNEFTLIREESETEIDRVSRDFMFFAKLYEQNREMEHFVNESLIIASGNKQAINEMYIINEAAAGDKIKGFFEKIKNFFKKIFDKLGASMNAVFMEQKKFIEQYQYICTKCKYKAGDVNDMKNHFVGFPRIIATVEKADQMIFGKNNDFFKGDNFDQADFDQQIYDRFFKTKDGKEFDFKTVEGIQNLIQNPPEKANPDVLRNEAYKKFIEDNGWLGTDGFNPQNDANGNVNIDGDFRTFFDGSQDGMAFDMDSIEKSWQTILNTVYAGEAYLKSLGKINDSVVRQMDTVEKNMTTYIQNQNNAIKSAVNNLKVGDNKAPEQETENPTTQETENPINPTTQETSETENPTNPTNQTKKITSKPKSETEKIGETANRYFNFKGNYFNEVNINAGSSPASGTENKGQSMTAVGTPDTKNVRDAQSNVAGKQAGTANAQKVNITGNVKDDASKQALQKGAETVLGIIETNAQAQVNANIQISSAISRQLYNAFQLTNKDFWYILKSHVNWYLGNPGQEKLSENVRSNPTNLNMNTGASATVGNPPKTTETSGKSEGET